MSYPSFSVTIKDVVRRMIHPPPSHFILFTKSLAHSNHPLHFIVKIQLKDSTYPWLQSSNLGYGLVTQRLVGMAFGKDARERRIKNKRKKNDVTNLERRSLWSFDDDHD
ncbi:hypothetical protein VNO77_25972 [Canavalia gladiata]|uniref:Uncharacterized protein n=1 Tax=Canavalia gladiata TaxID=3824 RepID=A0AAN9KV87_CANGL